MFKKAIPLVLISGLVLTGCGTNNDVPKNNETPMQNLEDNTRDITPNVNEQTGPNMDGLNNGGDDGGIINDNNGDRNGIINDDGNGANPGNGIMNDGNTDTNKRNEMNNDGNNNNKNNNNNNNNNK